MIKCVSTGKRKGLILIIKVTAHIIRKTNPYFIFLTDTRKQRNAAFHKFEKK